MTTNNKVFENIWESDQMYIWTYTDNTFDWKLKDPGFSLHILLTDSYYVDPYRLVLDQDTITAEQFEELLDGCKLIWTNKPRKCVCGSAKLGLPHSTWCDAY